ncbi:ATP-binding protein [Acinetobacter sp. LoGeW2-3]|uniref:ATP-binding protein n=1 Tax=Acinetobacter sp. LoGeW2-3 TaxID=1808001 RepID=UPI000C05B988|nr:AAA family ATPase [Acinetobacter sp. LoGeW2-3]ATO19390.1 ATP-binding protein [Acinetobacter sp. LoGeW2-3]
MQVESIQLKHTLHFSDIQLEFKYHKLPVTLILGDQGSGKTALLRSTYQALTWFAARYRDLRTAGVVMLDQDIMQHRLQSKINIQVRFPEEIGAFPESSDQQQSSVQQCNWQLYKTLNSQGVGVSKVDMPQLEAMVTLYQKALAKDPMLGLPLIAYYPADRFVNEINLLSKNNPVIFQTPYAYEVAAIPFTTFTRFFEWFREISDIENAQSAQILEQILTRASQQDKKHNMDELVKHIEHAQIQVNTPSLNNLREALSIVLPEVSNIYLQYQPKTQLMVTYQGQTQTLQQLPNSIRNWIALVGDIVRRLCLLNPKSLFPCKEGSGILLIDAIDHQLDQDMAAVILPRLHQAFPELQIIATGNRPELLEQAADFQCLRLEDKQLYPIQVETMPPQFDQLYADLGLDQETLNTEAIALTEPEVEQVTPLSILQIIQQQLNEEQQQELLRLLNQNDRKIPQIPF